MGCEQAMYIYGNLCDFEGLLEYTKDQHVCHIVICARISLGSCCRTGNSITHCQLLPAAAGDKNTAQQTQLLHQ